MHFYVLLMNMENMVLCNFNATMIIDMNISGLIL
jgi:hypothetical protein